MPPKVKGKGKGKPKGVEIDGVNTAEMTREQLEIFVLRMKEELDWEREERNYFQVERDKTRTFWEITRNKLDEAKVKIMMQDKALARGGEDNDEEAKKFSQEVKYFEYEQQRKQKEHAANAATSLQETNDEFHKQACTLLREKKELKRTLLEKEHVNMEDKRRMRLELDVDIKDIDGRFEQHRKDSDRKLKELYEKMHAALTDVQHLEMLELAERKGRQIANLEQDHEWFLAELHGLYDTITMNNFAMIDNLKRVIDKLSNERSQLIEATATIKAGNKRMREPLKGARKETLQLQRQFKNYKRDQFLVKNLNQQVEDTREKCVKSSQDASEMQIELEDLRSERDRFRERVRNGTRIFQHKLQQVHQRGKQQFDKLQEQLARGNAACLEARMPDMPYDFEHIDRVVQKKDKTIADMQCQIACAAKMHDDTIQVLDWKLWAIGIPENDLGYGALKICKYALKESNQ